MLPKGWIMLRVLIDRFHLGKQENIHKYMNHEDVKVLLSQDIHSNEVSLLLEQPKDHLAKIHYSWLGGALKKLPENLQPLVIAALPEPHSSGLATMYKQAVPALSLSEPMKIFLINTLYSQFEKKEILPLPFLPQTALNPLAELNKPELIEVIDYLGIYDLAGEIRQVVDKNVLKHLYGSLNSMQQRFLRQCLQYKEQLMSSRLEIDDWRTSNLSQILHRRGIVRLGKALAGQHPDFVWHIVHTLDTGRGVALEKQYSQEEIAGITPVLVLQVNNVINFIKKEKRV